MVKQKKFNITGICVPDLHYMVDTGDKLNEIIHDYIECNEYFMINRARQYGKSTTLELLYARLKKDYIVLDISFEAAEDCFTSVSAMAQGVVNKISRALAENNVPDQLTEIWNEPVSTELPLDSLSVKISSFCRASEKEVIFMVDEVDKAADNQIFLSFLGLLREKYLKRSAGRDCTFKSVILAGVHDIKNLKMKLHPGQIGHYNSPWNIAADFQVNMSFEAAGIENMLTEYEQDRETGMNIAEMSELIFDYTSGYPFLVSYICKLLDEKKYSWTREGLQEAVKILVKGPNTLYDDMIKQVTEYQELSRMLQNILFRGMEYPFHEYNQVINIGKMLGFIEDKEGIAVVSNRIFEMQLYSYFIAEEFSKNLILDSQIPDKNQFIQNGMLDMDLVMSKFYEYYNSLYRQEDDRFMEEHGRKIFLIYLKPIINGAGNFYIEAETRDKMRTDIVIDYRGIQYIIETKIWRGKAYHADGKEQLWNYLEQYRLEKGYMLIFNFNRKKNNAGIKETVYKGKIILEVVV